MLALPMTSAECERVFSSAKLLITAARNHLHPDIIEANECLRAWFEKPEKFEERVEREQEGQDGTETRDGDWSGEESEESEGSGDEGGAEDLAKMKVMGARSNLELIHSLAR
jgi:hypothetical protein